MALVTEMRSRLAASATETADAFGRLVTIADEKGVMEVADLVNNQPQFFLSAKYRNRDGELTGPDDFSAQIKWEVGFRNVNGLRKFCESRGETHPDPDHNDIQQPNLDCVATFLQCSKKNPADCAPGHNFARKAPRLSFSGEYTWVDSYKFSPEEGIDIDRDGSESAKAMFACGWQLRTEADGTGGQRLDFESMWEWNSGDPMKHDDCWVSSLTYSQQLAGETAASFSLVWANRPEFLGEVDQKLSARVGLKWTMDSKSK